MRSIFLLFGLLLATPLVLADTKALAGGSGAMSQMFLLAPFLVAFYFLILRPQSKRAKEHQQLVAALQKGEEVITSGGLLGRIEGIKESFVMLHLAEGVSVCVQKQAIASIVPKGTLQGI